MLPFIFVFLLILVGIRLIGILKMEMDMDLTNLNSTNTFTEIQILRSELKKQNELGEKLQLEIDSIRTSIPNYKSAYEDLTATIEDLHNQIDSVQFCSDDLETFKENEEAENLQIQTESLQSDLDNLKVNSDEIINNLKATILDLEVLPSPKFEEPDNSQVLESMKGNADLKEENAIICDAITKCNFKILELTQETASLELELNEIKETLAETQQAYKESNKAFEGKMEEKAILLSSLSQMNRKPLTEINQKSSLFDEVNDDRSDATTKYQIIKNKYQRAKDVLKMNNAEIKRLKDEWFKQNLLCSELEKDSMKAVDDLHGKRIQRIKDLVKFKKILEEKKKQSQNEQAVVINRSNFSVVHHFSDVAKAEETRIHEEIMMILAQKLPLEQKLWSCERELKNLLKQLKTRTDGELEKRLKQIQNDEQSNSGTKSSSEATNKKSIRFAQEVKYHNEK